MFGHGICECNSDSEKYEESDPSLTPDNDTKKPLKGIDHHGTVDNRFAGRVKNCFSKAGEESIAPLIEIKISDSSSRISYPARQHPRNN